MQEIKWITHKAAELLYELKSKCIQEPAVDNRKESLTVTNYTFTFLSSLNTALLQDLWLSFIYEKRNNVSQSLNGDRRKRKQG